MICPLHRLPVLSGQGDRCTTCERLGLQVIECELDKVGRTIDTLQEEGHEVDFRLSRAVIVVRNQLEVSP